MECRRPYLLAHFIILQRPQMLCCVFGNGSESRDICLSSNRYFNPFGVMVSGHGIGFEISAWENGHRIRF